MRILGFVVGAFLLLAPPARAQDFEAAARHFGAAQEAFGKQHYHSSAAEFQLAFEITKDPVLLYNIGEAWQKAGEGRKAAAAYRAYLKAQPAAQDRADVQKRLKQIEAKKYKIANQSAPGDGAPVVVAKADPPPAPPPVKKEETLTPDFDAPTPPPPAPEAPPPAAAPPAAAPPAAAPPVAAAAPEAPPVAAVPAPQPKIVVGLLEDQPTSRLRVAAWIGVAATVAVLTAGAIFALSAQSRADEISRRFTFVDTTGQPQPFDAAAQKDYHDLKNDGELYNRLAIGFFSVAGALAVTTTALFVVDYKRPQKQRAWNLSPGVGKNQAGLNAGWSF